MIVAKKNLKISIIIPVLNEEKNIIILVKETFNVLRNIKNLEIVVVDDGSTDKTFKSLNNLTKSYSSLKIIRHKKNYGQSVSLRTGILTAKNNFIVTMDGDGQNNPKDIMKLIKYYETSKSFFLVIGNRINRHDNLNRKVASRLAFFIRRMLLSDDAPDSGCALKIFKKEDFIMLPFFNHIHRFFPILFKAYGGKVLSVNVSHRKRLSGESKYSNLSRALVGIYDIIGVLWLKKRSLNPKLEKF